MNCGIVQTSCIKILFPQTKKQVSLLLLVLAFCSNVFAQPANDDPCNAIPLTAAATCTYTTYTNALATGSTGVPAPGCANYLGGDVWFTVVVPAGGGVIIDGQTGVVTDGGMAIYQGTCTGLTLISCDDDSSPNGLMPQITASGLTPGSTIWVRFWEYGNNNNGTFGICVTLPPPAPANDNPCNAITLPVTATCTYATHSNAGATATTGVPAPGCANYLGGDVWFNVIVPAGGAFTIDTQTGVITDGGMAVYSGTCTGLTLISCDDDSSPNGLMPRLNVSGQTPGATLWIRVWEYGNNNNGTFGICVTLPPPPPANDEPCTAISLTPASTCTYSTYTNAGATSSAGVPAPGCANYVGGDVWFTVTVPSGGALLFDTQTGVVTDGGMAIYSGTCTGLTLISCDDDSSPNGAMPQINASGLTPGSTIWIRVWERGNDNNGTFGICVRIPPPPGPGDICSMANAFCSSTTYTFPNSTNVPSLGGGGTYGCLLTTPNPVWYFMQIQNPGPLSIGIVQTSSSGAPLDVDFILWGPFTSLASGCNGISSTNIVDCSYSISNTETADIPNGIPGQFYILLLTNFSNQPGSITFSQTSGTGSSNCAIICNVTATNSGPVCSGSAFNLTASTITGATGYAWTGPGGFTSNLQNPTGVISQAAGPNTYTVTVTTASTTCSTTTVVTVNPRPLLGPDKLLKICPGGTGDLTTLYTTTGLATSWTLSGNPVANPSAITVAGTYRLIATNTSNCTDTAFVTASINDLALTVSAVNANCTSNGTVTVTRTGGTSPFTYSINGGTYQSSNIFSVAQGTYTATVRDSTGCVRTAAPVTVGFTNNLTLQSRPDTTLCPGVSVVLGTVSNASSFIWTPAAGLSNASIGSPIATPQVTTQYIVTANLGTCSMKDTVNITVLPAVTVYAGPDVNIIAGDQVFLGASATNAMTYLWSPPAGLSATNVLVPAASPAVTTTYTLRGTNTAGCTATDNVVVTVVPYCVRVKNAFTPNGDGVNETWEVFDQYDCLRNISLYVFNRYGNKVFESKDYRNKWDGRYNGKSLPDATYYAVIEFTLITGRVVTIKTDVTILR